MAVSITKYASEYSKTQETPIARRLDSTYEGAMQFKTDTFTLSGDLVGGTDGISFGKLPAGCKVYDVIVTWTDLDSGVTGTIDVGYLGALTAFHSALDVHTGAGSARIASTVGMIPITSEVDLLVSINGDTNLTTGSIKVTVLYVLD